MNKIIKDWEEVRISRNKKLKEEIKLISGSLPEMPDGFEGIITTAGSLRIGMPLDPPLNKAFMGEMEDLGWEIDEPSIPDYGWGQFNDAKLRNEEGDMLAIVDLAAFAHKEGSTCEIVGTKEITETKKVYEIKCKEE